MVDPAQWITVTKLYFSNLRLLIAGKSLWITVTFSKQAYKVNLFKKSGLDASCKIAFKCCCADLSVSLMITNSWFTVFLTIVCATTQT